MQSELLGKGQPVQQNIIRLFPNTNGMSLPVWVITVSETTQSFFVVSHTVSEQWLAIDYVMAQLKVSGNSDVA